MAALVRAGVPLERGLTQVSRELPGSCGPAGRTPGSPDECGREPGDPGRGQRPLPADLAGGGRAGMRAGKSLDRPGVHVHDGPASRRSPQADRAALLYPLVVCSVAYGLLVFQMIHLAPITNRASRIRPVPPSRCWPAWLAGASAHWWAVWLPALAVLLLVVGWYRSDRTRGPPTPNRRPPRELPT